MLSKDKITELTHFAQKCIYTNAGGDLNTLKDDMRNSIFHVYGSHTSCKPHICNKVGDVSNSEVDALKSSGAEHHIYAALSLLLAKAHLLINNETNNTAELFMSIMARFNMGKRLNLIQRDGFQIRAYLSGLRFNKGVLWHHKSWKKHFLTSPHSNLKRYMRCQSELLLQKRKRCANEPKCKKRLKMTPQQPTSADYGPNIAYTDISKKDLQTEINILIEKLKVDLPVIRYTFKQYCTMMLFRFHPRIEL